MELLEQLTDEFIQIYERSPARLKSKLSSTIKDLSANTRTVSQTAKQFRFIYWIRMEFQVNVQLCY